MKKIISIGIITLLGFSLLNAQSKLERKALKKKKIETHYNTIKKLVTSGTFQFKASYAFALGNDIAKVSNLLVGANNTFEGNRVNLTNNTNFLKLNKENATINLPYFGRVHRVVSYNGIDDNGIAFEGNIEKHKIEFYDSKHKIEIKFEANKPQEKLKLHLVINSNGTSFLNVSSSNRQNIRYEGKISSIEVDEN